jgi:catechol 2,3-dioxygenase-like lactoylglutathione lyase family enzyme
MNGYVAIGVGDLAASRRFWIDTLGLPVSAEWPGQLLVGEAGGFEVLLDASGDLPVAKGVEIAFRVGADVLRAAVERVPPVRGPRDFGGPNGLEAAFVDPDGYVLSLYAGR